MNEKLILALIAIPLLCKIRTYEKEVENYVLSSWEHFLRRYTQNLSIYGTIYSMFMMALERCAASNKYQCYESSKPNANYFYFHVRRKTTVLIMKENVKIVMLLLTIPCTLPAYDFSALYAASSSVPEGGQMYYQIMNCPLTVIEFANIFIFEYLYRVNHERLYKIGLSLTEKYQIAENVRMLELLRPLARFHGCITCCATIAYLGYVRGLENNPSYPIFEEAINFVQLQGILMPIIFMLHERKERARKVVELKNNNIANQDYVERHNEAIMKGCSDHDFSISSVEHFCRRFFQNLSVYGTVSTMFMMVLLVLGAIPISFPAYDFTVNKLPASTAAPEGGQIPLTLIEFTTIAIFEYLFVLNSCRLRQIGFSLTERYQIVENVRMLELLKPLASYLNFRQFLFHGGTTMFATVIFFMLGLSMQGKPDYPIFEESINVIQLQGILMPIIFMRHERKERARRVIQLRKNNSTIGDFVSRHAVEFTRGWKDPTDAGTTRFSKVPAVPSLPAKGDGTRRFGMVVDKFNE
ncbi:hypothetical protein PRIPAC_82760 [Pristionchus pacificus]|uniref:G protein-coupled receptor n=1 Tax=Pristionchus pacificus TaxID=54126 RepID=A0A2A6CIZ2_PRIPA|nr:hypothetical protein PRIPAC_82760 [Pristionchus pacificus]|eukprot:PDM78172.1 G protein-coupled receptor [Pristionchus pacificus]